MALAQNQIKDLAVWVHPSNDPLPERLYTAWEDVFACYRDRPEVAVIETVNIQGHQSHQTYLARARAQGISSRRIRRALRRVAEIELRAQRWLEERFIVWPYSNFINYLQDPKDTTDLTRLAALLNITPRKFHYEQSRIAAIIQPKILRAVSCFGLRPDVCVVTQQDALWKVAFHQASAPEDLGIRWCY